MTKPTIIFFGSFQHYSVQILKALHQSTDFEVVGVVTTPPKPAGRKKELKKTEVQVFAEKNNLPFLTPEKLDSKSLTELSNADFFIVAGYGKLLPKPWLSTPKVAPLNVHFSLLPSYRGANPAEWAIFMGEKQSGVTLIKMSEKFDQGNIISQTSIPITDQDTRETLYKKLYDLGAKLTLKTLSHYLKLKTKKTKQPKTSPTSYARRLSRNDTFIPWELIKKATQGKKINPSELPPLFQTAVKNNPSILNNSYSILIDRSTRAFSGYPNLWTKVKTHKGTKRMKILSTHLKKDKLILNQVQLEGLKPSTYNQIKNQIL